MAEVLWRECARWLIKCEVLPQDHRVTWVTSQVIDLAQTLRDGVLLCQLLNKLAPGCIDLKEISLRPQMSQFLCMKNIRTFLQTCQNVFELKDENLFQPYMLFDYTDFGKVLHTLSVLSKSRKAEESKIKGFPSNGNKTHDYYNDDIYRNLEDIANEGNYTEFGEYEVNPSDYVASPGDDDIYEDLCSFQRNCKSEIPVSAVAPVEKRDYCLKELIETEKNYIEALNMIIKYFMRGLKSVLRTEDRTIIFKDIKELAEIHTGFHSELYKACSSTQFKVSDCFLHFKDKFVIYADYCTNLPQAQDLVEELCAKNEIVNQCIVRCQTEANDGKFKLRDLLSVPMQRVLKYHLLLKELIKNTPRTHEDYSGLEKALDVMLDLSKYINEVKRDSETLQIIHDIQVSITDLNMPENMGLKDYGRLLIDGDIKIKKHDDNKYRVRHIFVFNRVLLICKSTRGEQFTYKEALHLSEYKVEDVNTAKCGSKDKWSYYWYLVQNTRQTVYTMYAKTEETKAKWINAIDKALDSLSPKALKYTNHAFVMQTFEQAVSCADCGKLLYGLFNQGYKCQTCCIPVHKDCISTVRQCGSPSLPPRPDTGPLNLSHSSSLQEDGFLACAGSPLFKVCAKTTYSCAASQLEYPKQLSFETGDVILVTKKIDNIWWQGRLEKSGDEGIFPANHVEDFASSKRVSYEDPFVSMPTAGRLINPHDGYVNLNLEEHPWFVGTMDRDTAIRLLSTLPSGTFLVRMSSKPDGGYALSLKYNDQVKHMRIRLTDDGQLYYLSSSKLFKTIVEMIRWYEENSLSESFNLLNTTLMIAFKTATMSTNCQTPIGDAVAVHDFQSTAPNMLNFVKGDRITLLSKAGDDRGWWKGQIDGKEGYFPRSYVQEYVQEL